MRNSPTIQFFAHFLFILAAWTLVIKYLFPIAYSLSYGEPILTHVFWDFWWVIHGLLGYWLLNWNRWTYLLAVLTSVVEIIIVVTKFGLFLSSPTWNIWRTNWFINKLFVLTLFIWILIYFIVHKKHLRSLPNEK